MMSERNRKNNNTPISFEITIKKLIPYNTRISTKEFEIVHTNFQKKYHRYIHPYNLDLQNYCKKINNIIN